MFKFRILNKPWHIVNSALKMIVISRIEPAAIRFPLGGRFAERRGPFVILPSIDIFAEKSFDVVGVLCIIFPDLHDFGHAHLLY